MIQTHSTNPLVTVYMPTYNRAELLKRAVDSVLNQDYRNIELIVVDDNSTDSTHKYLASMAEEDSRFRYFINEKNSGACVSRNKAMGAANGEFITGIDDDDYFLPNHISSMLSSFLENRKDCIAVYPNAFMKRDKTPAKMQKRVSYCQQKDLLIVNRIGNQVLTKTAFMRSIGGFDEKLTSWQDLECWYRLLNSHKAKAYSTGSYTYVVDVSHPHERISTRKIENIIKSYNYFCTKHNMTYNQASILKLQLNPYLREEPSFDCLIRATLYFPKLDNIKRLVPRLLVKIKKDGLTVIGKASLK